MKNRLRLVHISLRGVNLNRIYKQCKNNDVELFNIDRKDYKNIEFDVDVKQKKVIKNIAKLQRYEYIENQKFGYFKIANFFKYRFGFLIGSFIFVLLNFFSSLFVWDIKIYGNSIVSKQEIINVLKSQKLSKGTIFGGANLQDIENQLINSIEDISLCSVIKKGTTIIINIKEKLQIDELTNINFENDIVAKTNLTITELNVVSGTALKKVGDSVKQGETIVASYILNSKGEKIPCKANAKIKAKTWHTFSEEYHKTLQVATRTGNVIKNSYLTLFSSKFYTKKASINFENYELETKEVYLTKNNFLPFKFYIMKYYETTLNLVEQDFEKDRQSVIERCQKNAYKQVKSNEIVTNIFDVVSEEEDRFIVTSYVEVSFEY